MREFRKASDLKKVGSKICPGRDSNPGHCLSLTLANSFQWALGPLFDATLPKLPKGQYDSPDSANKILPYCLHHQGSKQKNKPAL